MSNKLRLNLYWFERFITFLNVVSFFLLYSKPSTSDTGKEKQVKPEKSKKKKTPSPTTSNEGVVNPIYDEDNMGEFSMGDVDTDMFPDDQFQVTTDAKGGATSMANPLYQDPYMEDDDSPLSNF